MDSQNHLFDINDDDDELEILGSKTLSSKAPMDGSCTSKSKKPTKRQRTNMSGVWKHFKEPIDGKTSCIGCGKVYTWAGSNYGTSTLSRHISSCTKSSKYQDVSAMMLDHEAKLKSKRIDAKKVREIISMAIVSHDLPLSFVEYKWFRVLANYLNSDYKHISRMKATNDVMKVYCVEKEKLKRSMIDCPSRICLTSDCWTACTSQGYICLTAHFVDSNWKLNSKILSFCKMEPPHSGWELATKVYDSLKEWGIDKKIFSLTLDNASANDTMQEILKGKLSVEDDQNLLCNGKFFHVRCCAHILNIIVQEGLKVANEAVKKIRESIKYVKASEGKMKSFLECVSQVGGIDTNMGLRLDVSTRWNSTYTMLESGIKYQRAFNHFQLIDNNYKFAPINEEWKRGEKMCEFLNPFYEMTNLILGSSYPTSSMYFTQVWQIECFLKENEESEDELIRNMVKLMIMKFDKYWSDYSIVLAFGAVLDPRAKLGMLQYCYSHLDQYTSDVKVDQVRSSLKLLFSDYMKLWGLNTPGARSSQDNSSSSSSTMTNKVGTKCKFVANWRSVSNLRNEKSELDQYLDEPALELEFHPDLDVLEYWNNNRRRYPLLSIMACDILSVFITTVAFESAFSIGARVLIKYRSRLFGDHVQAIICIRSWLQGFVEDHEEDLEKDTFSNEGSLSNVEVDKE